MKRFLPYLLLIFVVFVFFWQFVFLGRIPIDSTALYQMRPWSTMPGNPYDPSAYDTARYYHNIDPVVEVLPVKTWMAPKLREGDVPLWNFSLFSGTPFAANHHAAPWDASSPFFILFPSDIAFGITLVFQLFIAAASMFFFCKVLGFSNLPSSVAAVGFMLNNFFLHWLGLISFNAGLIWIPLIPAGIEIAFKQRRHAGWILSAAALALSFLSGMAQFWLFNLLVLITYTAYRLWSTKERNGLGTFTAGGLLLTLILGSAGGSVQLMQTVTALPYTSRGGDAQASLYEGRNHLSPRRLPTLLIPDLYGHHEENAYSKLLLKPPNPEAKGIAGRLIWGEKGSVLNRAWGYVGFATFFLMIAGWIKASGPVKYFRWLAICVIAFQVLLCWEPFHRFCATLWPGFDTLDHTRTIVLYSFSACILAAQGLATLDTWKHRRRLVLSFFYVGLVVLILTFLATSMIGNSLEYTQGLIHNKEQNKIVTPDFYIDASPQIQTGIRESKMILIPPILFTSVFILMLHFWYRDNLSTSKVQALLLILIAGDLFYRGWTDPPLEYTARERLYPRGSRIIEFLKNDPDSFRVYELHLKKDVPEIPLSRYRDLELLRKGTVRFFDFRSIEFVLRPNTLLPYGIDSAGGYLSLYPGRYKELWDGRGMDILKAIKQGQSAEAWNAKWIGMQNIKYLLLPEEVPTGSWRPEFQAEKIKVMKVDSFSPRYSAVGMARTFSNPEQILQEIRGGTFDPKREVLLEGMPQLNTTADSFTGSIQILSRTPDTVQLQASFSEDGYLVIAENNFPGWHASVDGDSVPILRANYAFQALALKKGKHSIQMEFSPAYYRISRLTSITAFLAMITFFILHKRSLKTI